MFRKDQRIGIYILIKRLGRGGFGEVWLAERRAKFVTTKVAVKLPLEEQIDVEAIKHEATLWEQASGHPNVLPIIDADEYDGQVVIVSEYAPDGSLDELLIKEGALPAKKAVEIVTGILSGLEFLHSKKIIHRDIKPANILRQGETPRLADFGISRLMKTTGMTQTVGGTPVYMAPEAFDGIRTVQTDIWSVGVILYQMLEGELPFTANNLTDLLGAIITKEPKPLRDSVPLQLQKIVAKALAKQSNERYQSVNEMREDLASFLVRSSQQNINSKQLDTTIKLSVATINQADQHENLSSLEHYGEESKAPYKRFLLPIIASLLLMVSFSAYFWFGSGKSKEDKVDISSQNIPRESLIGNWRAREGNVNLLINDDGSFSLVDAPFTIIEGKWAISENKLILDAKTMKQTVGGGIGEKVSETLIAVFVNDLLTLRINDKRVLHLNRETSK